MISTEPQLVIGYFSGDLTADIASHTSTTLKVTPCHHDDSCGNSMKVLNAYLRFYRKLYVF